MRKAIAELVTEIAESARVVGRLPRPGEGKCDTGADGVDHRGSPTPGADLVKK